jgi:hypothetical protein
MEINVCPCCGSETLAFQSRAMPGGLDISGRCRTCGYAWDSAYASAEFTDDLRCEFSLTDDFGLTD